MLLSYGYHVDFHHVLVNWLTHTMKANTITINIDTKMKVKIAFFGIFYGLTKIGKLFIILIVEKNANQQTQEKMLLYNI